MELPRNLEFGTVVAGRRHSNCYETLLALGLDVNEKNCVDGFMTANNLFLARADSYLVAKARQQLNYSSYNKYELLVSEMLYMDS